MRRRRIVGDEDEMPAKLLVFQGSRYRSARTWAAAYTKFRAARQAWADERGVAEWTLPQSEVNGHCPFDYERFRVSHSG